MFIKTRIVLSVLSVAACIPVPVSAFVTGGEFKVSSSGSANYSIPIHVPPGIAGVEPMLAFHYDSQSGNGLLGAGWALAGQSAIARCSRNLAQDGGRRGVKFDLQDRFCLDGQRLIAINGVYGENGTEYRTEIDNFSRIVSYGATGTGPLSFTVWTKSGLIVQYGATADSRIEAQGKGTVAVWAQNKVSDTAGNFLVWSYFKDSTYGTWYPTRIDYTGHGSSAAPFASVRFDYASRADVNDTYVAGSRQRIDKRLIRASVFRGNDLFKTYSLGYAQNTASQASRIVSVAECDRQQSCLPQVSFEWKAATYPELFSNTSGSAQGPNDAYVMAVGDVDGDGLDDVVWASSIHAGTRMAKLFFSRSTESSFAAPIDLGYAPIRDCGYYEGEYYECQHVPFVLGDINGDGRADLILGDNEVRLATQTGFQLANWTYRPNKAYAMAAGDVDGDGLIDIVWASAVDPRTGMAGLYFSRSTGNAFAAPAPVGPSFSLTQNCSHYEGEYYGCAYVPFVLGDVDGDGRADLVSGNGVVLLSTGTGFQSGNWAHRPSGAYAMAIGDVDGDSLDDVVWANGIALGSWDTQLYYSRSTGNGFSAPVSLGRASIRDCKGYEGGIEGCKHVPFFLGSLSGSGGADLAFGDGVVQRTNIPDPDLLVRIASAVGPARTIVYATPADTALYFPDTGAVYPFRDLSRRAPLPVVKASTVEDGLGGLLTARIRYGGARLDLRDRGFLGFRWIENEDAESGLVSRTEYRQDFPFVGQILSTRTRLAGTGGGVLQEANYSYACTDFDSVAGCQPAPGKRYFPFNTRIDEKSWEVDGTALPITRTDTVLDCTVTSTTCYGNATALIVTTLNPNGSATGYIRSTTNTYYNDSDRWILGRLIRSVVQNQTP